MKFHAISLLALMSIFAFSACDEIDLNDRFEELPAVKVKRTVLIEEFTGQMCTNCPDAHRLLNELKSQYKDQIIVVGIHSGSFGLAEGMSPAIVGLMQPEGNEYATKWDIDSYPAAVINRNSGKLSSNTWAGTIRNEFERDSELELSVFATLANDENGEPIIDINTRMNAKNTMEGKLQLWIVENGITALQIDNGKTIMDYTHSHVYRASVNGTWGEEIILSAGNAQSVKHSISVKPNWKTENLEVVAFVYTENDGVHQAAQCKVITE